MENNVTKPALTTPIFSSPLAAALTLLGVALGLGNVWRFPYLMSTHGGSAFLLLFIGMMCLVAIPTLMCELALARAHRGATITVFRKNFGPTGRVLGYLMVLGVAAFGTYYTPVVGKVLYSAWYVMLNDFSPNNLGDYNAKLAGAGLQFAVGSGVLWAGVFVVWLGLKRGIEKISMIFVPFFFLVMLYLVYFASSLPGSFASLRQFMVIDFSQIGLAEVFAAMRQCFFSVGLGASFMLVYGKYLSGDTRVGGLAIVAASGATLASILATLFVVPTVAVFGLDLNGGPGLLFETIPELLSLMSSGRLIGTFLLLALSLVAFLSAVAVFQLVIVALEEEPIGQGLGRPRLLLLIGVSMSVAMAYSAWNPEMIRTLHLVIRSGFMVCGGVLALLAMTWSFKRSEALAQIFNNREPSVFRSLAFLWMRYVIPAVLISLFLGTIFLAIKA